MEKEIRNKILATILQIKFLNAVELRQLRTIARQCISIEDFFKRAKFEISNSKRCKEFINEFAKIGNQPCLETVDNVFGEEDVLALCEFNAVKFHSKFVSEFVNGRYLDVNMDHFSKELKCLLRELLGLDNQGGSKEDYAFRKLKFIESLDEVDALADQYKKMRMSLEEAFAKLEPQDAEILRGMIKGDIKSVADMPTHVLTLIQDYSMQDERIKVALANSYELVQMHNKVKDFGDTKRAKPGQGSVKRNVGQTIAVEQYDGMPFGVGKEKIGV